MSGGTRRPKRFEERRQELAGVIGRLTRALHDYEMTGDVFALRDVAVHLRALVVRKKNAHPLLLDLAREREFPLRVYMVDAKGFMELMESLGVESVEIFTEGDSLSLSRQGPYQVETTLESAMEVFHTQVAGESQSLKEVVCLVADTEGAHFDRGRPLLLDRLDSLHVFGLPVAYRTIYHLGKVVRDLGMAFLDATQ